MYLGYESTQYRHTGPATTASASHLPNNQTSSRIERKYLTLSPAATPIWRAVPCGSGYIFTI